MTNQHDRIEDLADAHVHGLLSDVESQQLLEHCRQCESCQQTLQRAVDRLEAMLQVPEEEVSPQSIQQVMSKIRNPEAPAQIVEKRQLKPDSPVGTSTWREKLWFAVTIAAAILATLNIYWVSQAPSRYNLIVYGQNELFSGTSGAVRVALFDTIKQEPVSATEVQVDLFNERTRENIRLASFVTNANGTGTPRFELPDWTGDQIELRVSAATGWTPESITRRIKLKRNWRLMLSSDKPVYQPGQKIHSRCLALRNLDQKPVAGQEVTWKVVDPKGNLISKQNSVTSNFGITSFDCQLSSELIQGLYRIECELAEAASAITVDVKDYVLPKFKVDVSLDRTFYEPNQKVIGNVKADYFFGKPVADGSVEVTIRDSPGQFSGSKTVTVSLDANGQGKFNFRTNEQFAEETIEQTVNVAVTDQVGQQHDRSVTFPVTKRPLKIELIPESSPLLDGIANRIFVFASYADGKPAKTRISVTGIDRELVTSRYGVASFDYTPKADPSNKLQDLHESNAPHLQAFDLTVSAADEHGRRVSQQFELSAAGISNNFLLTTDKAVYDGGQTLKLTCIGGDAQPILIDIVKDRQTLLTETVQMQDGTGTTQIDLPPELEGTLQICAYRLDSPSLPIKKLRTIFVRSASDLKITTRLDKESYRPGESAKLTLKVTDEAGNPAPGAVGLAVIDAAVNSVHASKPGLQQAFFAIDQELLKPVYQIYPWYPRFSHDSDLQREELEMAAFSRISSQSSHEKQLAQLLDFMEEDPSVFEVLKREDIDELADSVWLPDGAFELLRGNQSIHSLTATTAGKNQRDFDRWRSKRIGLATTLWFILGVFVVVLFLSSMSFRVAECAVIVVILLVLTGMLLPAVQQVREAARRTQAMNNLRQIGLAINNAEEAGLKFPQSKSSSSAASPYVRKWFPETLLWRPEIITDDQGHATVDVELADSITTWQVTTNAVSEAGKLGGDTTSLKVFQPFFVDINLPTSFTRYDEVTVPIVVYNYSQEKQTVQIAIEEADWFELTGDDSNSVQSISMEANETKSIALPMKLLRIGDHQLKVTAAAKTDESDIADAIVRSVKIVPEGKRIESVVNGSIEGESIHAFEIPSNAVDQSGSAIVKIYPTRFSQIVEGLDAVFQRPHGCFEQTSSTTYPSVLALNYLRQTGKSIPEVEVKAQQYIELGYQRLLTFEVAGGGFDWFGNPPANRILTAYGLMEFADMSAVTTVDPELIRRTRKWLLDQQRADGSWASESHGLHARASDGSNLSTTAYIAWAVYGDSTSSSESRLTLKYLLDHSPEEIKSPYQLALVCNALFAMNAEERAVPYVNQLVSLQKSSSNRKFAWWSEPSTSQTLFLGAGQSADIESTAMATLALLSAKSHSPQVAAALKWLVKEKDPQGTWHSTQATVLALKALLQGTGVAIGEMQPRQVDVKLDGKSIQSLTIPVDQFEVVQQVIIPELGKGKHSIELDETGRGSSFQLVTRHHINDPKSSAEALEIDLAYERTEFAVRESVEVEATVTSHLTESAPMVMVTLPIPPGFAIQREAFDGLVEGRRIEKYDITPRSAMLYLRELAPGQTIRFKYYLSATMPLKVTAPPATVYLYYTPEIKGICKATMLTAQ